MSLTYNYFLKVVSSSISLIAIFLMPECQKLQGLWDFPGCIRRDVSECAYWIQLLRSKPHKNNSRTEALGSSPDGGTNKLWPWMGHLNLFLICVFENKFFFRFINSSRKWLWCKCRILYKYKSVNSGVELSIFKPGFLYLLLV
jgi:hypothetical protein